MTNAVKYSGRCRELRIVLDRAGSEVRLQIADGGIGIEPSEQRTIFERFYRTPAAARETGGTGLGLALVRHFAESHGGERDGRERTGAREHVHAPPPGSRAAAPARVRAPAQ